ncbi:MAG: N-acetylmuramoyl-L-alanine amidase, partial [Lachnospiraceae bacterium]|nr:N-acetylmuramoyl-L-alanine amidase [Lachnospiraceae bacterium]
RFIMKIIKNTSYSNTSSYPNRPIKYIVLHYTAGSTSRAGSAVNSANRFSNPSEGVSADFIVDDATAVQFNPDIKNRYCWHCGDSRNNTKGGSLYGKCTNANSIGIEVCCTNDNYSNSTPANHKNWYFTDAVVNKAVELTKYLMQTYNIPAANVVRHYDVSGKACPGITGWNAESGSEAKWQAFKARLTGASTVTTQTSIAGAGTSDNILYRVRKSANDAKTQIGAFKNLNSAKALADKNKGYSVFDKSGKLVYKPASAATSKKSVAEIAKEVIAGKWGNGSERKAALEKAGYDYNAVQSEVNRLLR